jgi:hypothetical protein
MNHFRPLYSLNKAAYCLYSQETDYVQLNFNMLSLTLSKEDFVDFAQDPSSQPLFATVQNPEKLFELLEGSDTALLQLELETLYEKEY